MVLVRCSVWVNKNKNIVLLKHSSKSGCLFSFRTDGLNAPKHTVNLSIFFVSVDERVRYSTIRCKKSGYSVICYNKIRCVAIRYHTWREHYIPYMIGYKDIWEQCEIKDTTHHDEIKWRQNHMFCCDKIWYTISKYDIIRTAMLKRDMSWYDMGLNKKKK